MKTEGLACLVDSLAALPGSEGLFNPYAPQGGPGAAIRRENLLHYLVDMEKRRPHMLLLFEAPGYRGCALSGIPVTSERIMLKGIDKWGLFGTGYRATSDHPQGVAEMTATILWNVLDEHVAHSPLIWNTVPLHPHRPGQAQSNRSPRKHEEKLGLPFIEMLVELFEFEIIGAVGRVAQRALNGMGYQAVPLRHPSQGGKEEFIQGLLEIASS
ncbi:MAG: uracil-DNA glycosylase [Anaerolineae bacterium]|nr:uracil-DNA glycosylase [Anaerolineae bacterium]